ncbi:MAG: hypothetical protein AMJ68_01275 [Acidithiobacillales bacterium SG8_45]|nr:MAG: hypothetical protein AMJ68_01275 [Acidithiobacillales bacterium SG8_45]
MPRGWRIWLVLLVCLCSTGVSYAETGVITSTEWARPRSGSQVVSFEVLQGVVSQLEQRPKSAVTIHYAGGDEGLLWAEELRGWLVALGVTGNRINLVPGLAEHDRILLETD